MRRKDGKEHCYWSIVENRRGERGRVIQRQVLYLGEINDSQRAAWCRSIEVFESGTGRRRQIALFPEDPEAPEPADEVVHVRLDRLQVCRPRRWGGCRLACELWDQPEPDQLFLLQRLHLHLPPQPPPRLSLNGPIPMPEAAGM
jgi:hypothetical protein